MSVEYDDLPASSGLDLTSTFLASVAGVKGVETIANLAALLATSGGLADAIDDKLAIAGHTANALLVADGSGAVVDAASLTSAQHGSQTATTHHATATNALNGFASSAHIATLEALAANAPLVEQIVSTSSATIADTTTLVRVTFGGAVTLKVNARAAGTSCVIRKETTNSGTITVDSDTGLAMNGGTVNASFVLPGSGQGGTNPKTDGEWLLSFVSSSDVRITARVYIDCIPRTGHPAGSILVADGSGAYADVYVTTAAMLPTVAAHTVLTRAANSTGQAAAQSVGTDEGLFNVAGVLTSQKAQTANIADAAITGAKIVQSGTIDVGSASITTTGGVTSSLLKSGAGSPEGAATAGVGAIYRDTTNGRFYIKRTGSGNTGWVQLDRCESGTYTPTGTIVSNLDSVIPGVFTYLRVGDIVSVFGDVSYDPTAASYVELAISLPLASNFTSSGDLSGSGGAWNCRATADTTNDRAAFTINNSVTSGTAAALNFQYRVL